MTRKTVHRRRTKVYEDFPKGEHEWVALTKYRIGKSTNQAAWFSVTKKDRKEAREEARFIFKQFNMEGDTVELIRATRPIVPPELRRESVDKAELFSLPEEVSDEQKKYPEGGKKRIIVNAYERNSEARQKCIKHHGSKCSVCNFDFGKAYGKKYEGFIHVHHIKPVSEMPENYEVDPKKDLAPVCPNCHAIIHYGNRTLNIGEIKKILKR